MNEFMNASKLTEDREYYDGLINEKQAATFLGYTVRALQNWRTRGGGPKYVKVSNRSVRYRRRGLIEWIEQRTVSNTSEPTPV